MNDVISYLASASPSPPPTANNISTGAAAEQSPVCSPPRQTVKARAKHHSQQNNRPQIWSVEETPGLDMLTAPLQAKCSAYGDERHGAYCRELIGGDERQLVTIDPDIARGVRSSRCPPPRRLARAS